MEYTLLIHGSEDAYRALDKESTERMYAEHGAFMAALRDAGITIAYSAELDGAKSARVVRRDGAGQLVTDGPYAETKEQLGGFYVLDVPDIDTAVEWARRIPMLPGDAIEVRPTL